MDEAAQKCRHIREIVGPDVRIEVDGGIDATTVAIARDYGADTFVAGNAVFGQPDRKAAIDAIQKAWNNSPTGGVKKRTSAKSFQWRKKINQIGMGFLSNPVKRCRKGCGCPVPPARVCSIKRPSMRIWAFAPSATIIFGLTAPHVSVNWSTKAPLKNWARIWPAVTP